MSRIVAFVPAGGEGTRLRPYTAVCPEPALPFDAVLQYLHLLDRLQPELVAVFAADQVRQAPSDYPEFAGFLVELGIDSISVSPDSFLQVKRAVAAAEARAEAATVEPAAADVVST